MIKFLVDENIGQSIIHYLKEQGYDVKRIGEVKRCRVRSWF